MRVFFILSCLIASSLTQGANEEATSGVLTASPNNGLDEVAPTSEIISSSTSSPAVADGSNDSKPRQKKCRKPPRTKPKTPSCRKPPRSKDPPAGTVCFSLRRMMQDTIPTEDPTMSPSLIDMGSDDEGQTRKIDLSSLQDQVAPLVTTLQTQIQAIRNTPEGSDSTGVLDQILVVLEGLLKSLFPDGPIQVGALSSKLLETVMLLIGYDVIDQEAGDGRSTILSNILSSVVPPILELLKTLGVRSTGLLETLSASVDSLLNSGVQGLLGGGRQPSEPAPNPQSAQSASDGPGLIGGLLDGLLG